MLAAISTQKELSLLTSCACEDKISPEASTFTLPFVVLNSKSSPFGLSKETPKVVEGGKLMGELVPNAPITLKQTSKIPELSGKVKPAGFGLSHPSNSSIPWLVLPKLKLASVSPGNPVALILENSSTDGSHSIGISIWPIFRKFSTVSSTQIFVLGGVEIMGAVKPTVGGKMVISQLSNCGITLPLILEMSNPVPAKLRYCKLLVLSISPMALKQAEKIVAPLAKVSLLVPVQSKVKTPLLTVILEESRFGKLKFVVLTNSKTSGLKITVYLAAVISSKLVVVKSIQVVSSF